MTAILLSLLCASIAGIIILSLRAVSFSRSPDRARSDFHETDGKLRELSELARRQRSSLSIPPVWPSWERWLPRSLTS